MKKKLKELIANAEPRLAGRYDMFLIVSENKPYGGAYGKNGYNFMTVLGFDDSTKKWYKVSASIADVLVSFDKMSWNIDIPTCYNCVRIWFDHPVYINMDIRVSSVRVSNQQETKNLLFNI